MGKITSIITFSGKLGNTVGSKGLRGRHLIRARQHDVKNPRSNAQNVQRMIFATAATSLAYLTEILNNSFEGKAFGQESLSYARKVNLDLLRGMNPTSSITGGHFLKKGEKFFAPNEYILSQGILNSPDFILTDGADYSIRFTGSPAWNATLTASQIFPDVAVGDQITIISVGAGARSYRDEVEKGCTEVRYCRFAFKDNTTPALVSDGEGGFVINPAAIDLVKAKGPWNKLTFDTSENGLVSTVGMHSAVPAGLMAAAVLVSNLENNRRSNSRMAVLTPSTVTRDWLWHGGDAYPTYGNVSADQYDFASDVYLNNSASTTTDGASIPTTATNIPGAVAVGSSEAFNIQLPAEPTEVRYRLSRGGSQMTSNNIVGAATGAAVVTGQPLVLDGAPAWDGSEVYEVQMSLPQGTTGQAFAVLGGYAIVNGQRYTF